MDFQQIINFLSIIALFFIGLLSFLFPYKAACFGCRWRFKDGEPTKGYVKVVKIGGLTLIIITLIAVFFLYFIH